MKEDVYDIFTQEEIDFWVDNAILFMETERAFTDSLNKKIEKNKAQKVNKIDKEVK